MSFSMMNQNYKDFQSGLASQEDIDDFRWYLLTQNTIIIPESWELICSPNVEQTIKLDPELVMNRYFYVQDGVTYFIYSKYFPEIWVVKVLFDTTPYIHSQLIIIKIGLIFIGLVFILQFFAGRYISAWLLRDLKNIGEKLKSIDINSKEKHIICECLPDDDEIKILAEALNVSYDTIDEQTTKLKQFLTDVSHEFKTPLMALSSRLDLLDKKSDKWKISWDDMKKHFQHTRQNISRLNGLLESLFFLSRVEEHCVWLLRDRIEVKNYMDTKLHPLAESFPDKTIDYDIQISDDLEYIVDETTYSILIDNLVTNAIKFSPNHALITIYADEKWFSILDNGPWIWEDNHDKIWEKFYRSDTNKEWFWVGLYLVKRIVLNYGWRIYVDKKNKQGAKFKVEISI